MKVNAITIRAGHVIEQDGKLWVVLKSEIFQPGKGASVVQVEMRDVRSGTKTNVRYRTQETVEKADLYETDYTFLFAEGDSLTFMNKETYDQINVPVEVVGDKAIFLQDGMTCQVKTHEGVPLSVTLPDSVVLKIVEADPVVKGQTAASSYKPAIMENGARVMVPPFIESGESIVVRTEDSTYVERSRG